MTKSLTKLVSQTLFLQGAIAIITQLLLATVSSSKAESSKKYFKHANDWYETYPSPLLTSKSYPDNSEHGQSASQPRLIPIGTKLELRPKLIVPAPAFGGITSELEIAFPVTFPLEIEALQLNKIWEWDRFGDQLTWATVKDGFLKARKKRSLSENSTFTSDPPSLCTKLSVQKLTIFKKLENVFNSFNGYMSWNGNGGSKYTGKSCLLRTICEIQLFPVTQKFGVFGDLLKELVRVDQFNNSECGGNVQQVLKTYIKAQQAGAKGSCSRYYEMCTKSLLY